MTTTSQLKAAGLTFLLYLVLSVVSSIVLTGIWQAGVDTSSMTNQEIMLMAETSTFIKTGSAIIGLTSAMLCAFILSLKTSKAGFRPTLYFALMLIAYGAISIVLHPEHTLMQQVLKILVPVPACLFSAWVAQRFTKPSIPAQSSQAA